MRKVICHYHIFKNSGTSFDEMLCKNYGNDFVSFDGPFPYFSINQIELMRIIQRHGQAIAFSSHQIRLPQPVSLDIDILPVIFVRHPLFRIKSIYTYKRKIQDGTPISRTATAMNFAEWVEFSLKDRAQSTHIVNAQTRILGGVYGQNSLQQRVGDVLEYDLLQALRNIQAVKLLARTEFFDRDVKNMQNICADLGVNFTYYAMAPQNTSSNLHSRTLGERVQRLKDELGESLYQQLICANEQDLAIYDYAMNRLDQVESSD